eukprot:79083_1
MDTNCSTCANVYLLSINRSCNHEEVQEDGDVHLPFNFMQHLSTDLIFAIINYSNLVDFMLNHKLVCQRWYNLIEISKYDKTRRYQLINLWIQKLKHSFRNNHILQSLNQTSPMNAIYFKDDGAKMLAQFVHGMHGVKERPPSKYTLATTIDFLPLHPWLRSPSKHGLNRGQLFGMQPNSHLCMIYMEPTGFDPYNEQNMSLDKRKLLDAIHALSVFENKDDIHGMETALAKIYDSKAIYAFIWVVSLIVKHYKFYGYDNCLTLLRNKMNLAEWHYACNVTMGKVKLQGGLALWQRRKQWYLTVIKILDLALQSVMALNQGSYQVPNRTDHYFRYTIPSRKGLNMYFVGGSLRLIL